MKTDRAWAWWGTNEQYFGVLTDERFLSSNLTEDQLDAFFESGRTHVDSVFELVAKHFSRDANIEQAVDFGCGTGRLLIPLARRAKHVIGVDVSPSMLAEAKENCAAAGIENVKLVASSEFLGCPEERFDLLHSVLVFQHIRKGAIERILTNLLARLETNGIVAVQMLYSSDRSALRRVVTGIKNRVPFGHRLANVIARGRRAFAPMEMNLYDLNRLVGFFYASGIRDLHLRVSMDGDFGNIMILGQKTTA